ncbi:MAG: hypothetical protein HYY24_27655 [Verrucomicrobia bacterium]|nr:hypothetical protein [Verrucomicrobiota bacterium]
MSLTEILPRVRNLAAADKLRLIGILAEEVAADVAPLESDRTYVVATPVFEPGAAEALMDALRVAPQG